MALKKVSSPTNNPGDLSKIYTGDWNDLVDVLKGAITEALVLKDLTAYIGTSTFAIGANGGAARVGRASDRGTGVFTLQLGNNAGASKFEVVDGSWDRILLYVQQNADEIGLLADAKLAATKKLYLDGGGDTYIYEHAANDLRAVVGGALKWRNAGGYTFFYSDPVSLQAVNLGLDANYGVRFNGVDDPGWSIRRDGTNNEMRFLTSLDTIAARGFVFGTDVDIFAIRNSRDVGLRSGSRLYLDGVATATGDTYLYEYAANALALFAGGNQIATFRGDITARNGMFIRGGTAAAGSADHFAGSFRIWIDEATNSLKVTALYSDGATFKSGTICALA